MSEDTYGHAPVLSQIATPQHSLQNYLNPQAHFSAPKQQPAFISSPSNEYKDLYPLTPTGYNPDKYSGGPGPAMPPTVVSSTPTPTSWTQPPSEQDITTSR